MEVKEQRPSICPLYGVLSWIKTTLIISRKCRTVARRGVDSDLFHALGVTDQ